MVIVGPHATDLIEAAVVAIDAESTVETVADGIAPHPTLSEAIKEAGLVALGRAIHLPPKRRRWRRPGRNGVPARQEGGDPPAVEPAQLRTLRTSTPPASGGRCANDGGEASVGSTPRASGERPGERVADRHRDERDHPDRVDPRERRAGRIAAPSSPRTRCRHDRDEDEQRRRASARAGAQAPRARGAGAGQTKNARGVAASGAAAAYSADERPAAMTPPTAPAVRIRTPVADRRAPRRR